MDQISKCGPPLICEGLTTKCPEALEWVKPCVESVERENEKANDAQATRSHHDELLHWCQR